MRDINPADIEQIEVIKGPAAATLYAPISRGCPVIRIRTRRPGSAPPPAR
jgi:outer membrane receptor for ferrienterochelin and colicin